MIKNKPELIFPVFFKTKKTGNIIQSKASINFSVQKDYCDIELL